MGSAPALLAALACWLLAASAPAAEEEVTHRVAGLFSPSREADLRAALEKVTGVKLVRVDLGFGEAVFRYDAAAAFPGAKPEQVIERLNNALRDASHHTFGIAARITTPRDNLQRLVLAARGCDCKACNLAAYESVSGIDGIVQATSQFREGKITALFDPAKTNRAAIEEALKKRGVALVEAAKQADLCAD